MLFQLTIATLMVMLTVAIHGIGLYLFSRTLRLEEAQERRFHLNLGSARGLGFTLALVLALFVLHGIEIWAYGVLFFMTGALPDLLQSIYFSTISYATIGFDDEGIREGWKLVAAIEGVNGIILLGWSTAFFVSVVHRIGGATR